IEGIYFADMNTGTIVAAFQNNICCGQIFRTTNAGVSWTNQQQPTDAQQNLHDVAFANADLGIAVGLNGIILKTTDGGANWVKQNSPILEAFFKIENIDPNTWVITGNGGIILKSTDAGASWTQQLNNTELFFEGLDFVNANIGYVCGS